MGGHTLTLPATMSYLKDPQALASCETGFDIADVLDQQGTIEVVDSKTSEWRVRLRSDMTHRSGFDRGSLPDGWEIGRMRMFNRDGEQNVEVDLIHVETVESFDPA